MSGNLLWGGGGGGALVVAALSPYASPKINPEARVSPRFDYKSLSLSLPLPLPLPLLLPLPPPPSIPFSPSSSSSPQKQPMRMRTHSCGPSLSGSGGGGEEGGEGGPARRHAGARRQQPATELLSTEELEEFTAALQFEFHAHTVDLVYQNSLLHTREELALVVAGPLTLNAVTFLLVLIRRGCQQIFGSLPSFTSDFIMAQGVWTVLDPGAVLAVDAVLGRLAYSPDRPVGDAAKLYWHFLRNSQSGAAGVVITLFLYAVLLLLSVTILFIYLLRFHNDGRMLDTFQRLSAREGDYFLPRDLELSNQELSHIVKKAEQWRGFNGERRKVAVSDYIWAGKEEEESPASVPVSGDTASAWIGGGGGGGVGGHGGGRVPNAAGGELSTHVSIYTLYLSGLRQRYRHFLRQADGSIVEVRGTPVFIRSSVHTHVHVDVKQTLWLPFKIRGH
uniref:Uncharacterized protein n=1 Tax=Gadus morhua TaxID=8049 RepID=A0A8C4YXK6_GADMO